MDTVDSHGWIAAMDLAQEAMMLTDAALDPPGPHIRHVNAAFERLTGYTRAELVGSTPRILQGPDTERAVLDRLRSRVAAGELFEGSTINYRKDGSPFHLHWRVYPYRDEAGTLRGFVSLQVSLDAGGLSAPASTTLRDQVLEQHALPMLLLDPATGAIADANAGAAHFYGYERARLRAMRIEQINELSAGEVRAEIKRAQSERSSYFVFRHRLANGEVRPVEVYTSPITIDGREYLYSIIHDISERDRLADEVQRRLYYDPVTELPNRGLFNDRLAQALKLSAGRDGCGTGILRVDVDAFRHINHLYGQSVGDTVLNAIAGRLQNRLGPQDTLARTGSDEFSVIMLHPYEHGAVARMAEQLCRAMREPLPVGDRHLHLTASAAVAVAPHDGTEAADLADRLDATMLEVKRQQGDAWAAYDAARTQSTTARVRLAADLNEALRGEQLRVAWQPVMRLDGGQVARGEALLRWYHPSEGWIRPDQFIPAAEASAQIISLGEWILDRAMRAVLSATPRIPTPLAVNVSLRQLRARDFVTSVNRILERTGFPASELELELTESAFADDAPELIERLNLLRAEGISIAIDDFGTGYSTLNYLRRLPIDRIKIDRSFISGSDNDPDNQALVATIVALAERFGLALTAEGIESAAEHETIVGLGVATGQGYYYGRPAIVWGASGADDAASPA